MPEVKTTKGKSKPKKPMKPSFAMLDMGDDSNEVKIVLWASRDTSHDAHHQCNYYVCACIRN